MNRREFLKGVILSATALSNAGGASANGGISHEGEHDGVKEFYVEVSRYLYTPSVFRVQKGDKVRFNLVSTDVEHSFYIDGYDLDVKLKPYEPRVLEFIADKSGAFQIRCSVTCGPYHPIMRAKLVVEPNYRFYVGLLLTFLVPFGSLLYLYWSGGDEDEENPQEA
ncbi:MAG: cupredoxin domain-containing protein [Candidatus Hydrothermarchaeales archaeon]